MRVIGIAIALTWIATAQNSASVEGRVIDSVTGLGIPDASVLFRFADREYHAVTDSSGSFQVFGMADGQYGARIEKQGFIPLDSATENSPLTIVSVDASQPPAQIRVALGRYARLSGRVSDREGRPVAGVSVMYTNAPGPMQIKTEQFTNAEGEFAFAKVVPGSYVLRAVPPSGAKAPVTPVKDVSKRLPTWYPSAADSNRPNGLRCEAAPTSRDLTFACKTHLFTGFTVSVRGPDGQPVRAIVRANRRQTRPRYWVSRPRVRRGRSDSSRCRGLPGPVCKQRPMACSNWTRYLAGCDAFRPAVPFGSSSGKAGRRCTRSDGSRHRQSRNPFAPASHDRRQHRVSRSAAGSDAYDPKQDRIFGEFGATPGGSVGSSFWIENVPPGEARIVTALGLAGGYYLDSVTLGGRDVTWKSVTLQPGAPQLRFVYKPNAGTVTGAIESPEADYVVLIPQPALDSLDVQYGRISRRTPGGTFEIDSVGPGSYYAFAVDHLDPATLSNPAAVRRIVNAAVIVQVIEGATISVKPPAIPPLW